MRHPQPRTAASCLGNRSGGGVNRIAMPANKLASQPATQLHQPSAKLARA